MSFDKTEACTIVSQDELDITKYWVSNGKFRYTAYGDKDYTIGATVYVTIP